MHIYMQRKSYVVAEYIGADAEMEVLFGGRIGPIASEGECMLLLALLSPPASPHLIHLSIMNQPTW